MSIAPESESSFKTFQRYSANSFAEYFGRLRPHSQAQCSFLVWVVRATVLHSEMSIAPESESSFKTLFCDCCAWLIKGFAIVAHG